MLKRACEAGMFHDFTLAQHRLGDVTIRARHAGHGPPIVLLHGHPRTHTTWHAVAPLLAAAGHTVVCPDLRGYGASTAPPDEADHAQASKRAMAADVVALMRSLGHDRFAVAGHDRGALVALRTAMDHPGAVSHLAVLEGLPVLEHLERADATFAAAWWHWWFFGQTEKPAEPIISRDPAAWYRVDAATMGPENHADWLAAVRDPETIHATLEDYRAGLGIDRAHEAADRAAGRRVRCPALLAVAIRDDLEALYGDPLAIWREGWADDIELARIDSGHHMAEEAPAETAAALVGLLRR